MVLKLITFDVTGTILTLRNSVGFQYAKVGSLYGLHASPGKLSDNFKHVFKELSVKHQNFGESCIGWEAWWKRLISITFQKSLEEKDIGRTHAFDKISKHLIEIYKTDECWKLVEGAQNLLQKLSRNNVLGVVSNYDPRLEEILINLKIRDNFKFVLSSYEAKCTKPNLGIFTAVEEMNCNIKKNEILHIGDNPKLDFLGAKNAGWNALLVTQNFENVNKYYPNIKKEFVARDLLEIYNNLISQKML